MAEAVGAADAGRGPLAALELRCPRCKGGLEQGRERYTCRGCPRDYPVVLGIPDFRLFPDPYLETGADLEQGRRLAERASQVDLASLLAHYWSTSDTSADLVRRYVRSDLVAVARGRHALASIERALPGHAVVTGRRVLELGCRSGGFLVAAAERRAPVIGIDIAFRWLVVARKRLEEHGLSLPLLCCCAQALPLADGSVDLVVAGNVIEHTPQQAALLREAHRVLAPGGALHAVTCNRFSLGPEPHVRVWGVGWLPRRLMSPYVKLRRGHPYPPIRQVGFAELRRLVRATPFRRFRLSLPAVGEQEQQGLPPWERRLLRLYHALKDLPGLRQLLLLCGPLLQLVCVKEPRA